MSKPASDALIEMDRYALQLYYGQPLNERYDDMRRGIRYILTVPNGLNQEQKEAILRMIMLMRREPDPDFRDIELRRVKR